MTGNSLTENDEHHIPSLILEMIFLFHASSYFLDPNMYGF